MSRASLRIRCIYLLLVLGFCLGCGSSDTYQPISGSVSYKGQALEKGVITLFPKGEGTTAGGEIVAGKYDLPRENGPTPGKYRVEIIAFKPSGKKEFDIDENKEVDIEVQFLPERYNRNSELEIEVATEGENVFDFDL